MFSAFSAKEEEVDVEGLKADLMRPTAEYFCQQSRHVPLRLSEDERLKLHLLEGALTVSDYTNKVDIVPGGGSYHYGFGNQKYGQSYGGYGNNSHKKIRRICAQLTDVLSTISGLLVAGHFKEGNRLVNGNSLARNQRFFQDTFEVGRRYKIMNPGKMRDTYGKMLYLLQDAANSNVQDSIRMSLATDVRTVYGLLEARGCLQMLEDSDLLVALQVVDPNMDKMMGSEEDSMEVEGSTKDRCAAAVEEKRGAVERLCQKYSAASGASNNMDEEEGEGEGRGAGAGGQAFPSMAEDEVRLVLNSLSDATAFVAQNEYPIARMLQYLTSIFDPSGAKSRDDSLQISNGRDGSCLSHSHSTQFRFVMQSLSLWLEVARNMYRLWFAAEGDMLDAATSYRLCDTGQGFNRLQPCPRVGREMHAILSRVQQRCGSWVGLSVVHLGDRDVPNALTFIDKYTQIARILHPIVRTLDGLADVARDARMGPYLESTFGGLQRARMMILCDYFKHGFDGSGDDGGSCIDGRLTSTWNWTSKLEKKPYYPLFMLTGFEGFDGDF